MRAAERIVNRRRDRRQLRYTTGRGRDVLRLIEIAAEAHVEVGVARRTRFRALARADGLRFEAERNLQHAGRARLRDDTVFIRGEALNGKTARGIVQHAVLVDREVAVA